jgi:hypothetical protein
MTARLDLPREAVIPVLAGQPIKHIWAVRNPEKLRPWTTG